MAERKGSRYELYRELERGLGQRGAVMLMEEFQAIRERLDRIDMKLDGMEERLESKLEAKFLRTVLTVNVPSILGAVGLAFAATRLG